MKNIKLPATMDHFDALMDFIREQAGAAGFDASLVNKIALAGEEAVVNVINYAYGDGRGEVEITADKTAHGEGLILTLTDSGAAFDPMAKADPDIKASVEDRPIGGLGIFMVKQIMDTVSYKYQNGQNVLIMVKHLNNS